MRYIIDFLCCMAWVTAIFLALVWSQEVPDDIWEHNALLFIGGGLIGWLLQAKEGK